MFLFIKFIFVSHSYEEGVCVLIRLIHSYGWFIFFQPYKITAMFLQYRKIKWQTSNEWKYMKNFGWLRYIKHVRYWSVPAKMLWKSRWWTDISIWWATIFFYRKHLYLCPLCIIIHAWLVFIRKTYAYFVINQKIAFESKNDHWPRVDILE